MSLFTIVLDFLGGTYVTQVEAGDAKGAILRWFDLNEYINDLPNGSRILESRDDIDEPVLLDGCINVWCSSILVDEDLGTLTIVETSRDSVEV